MQKRLRFASFYLPFAAVFVFLLLLYARDFMQGDDFTFWKYGASGRALWNSYVDYYLHAGSRMANVLASILLLGHLQVWQVLTPVLLLGAALLFYYYVTGRCRPAGDTPTGREWSLACLCALFPGLVPVNGHMFADTFLWMDGSCNYLYPMVLGLVGLLPFYNALRGRALPKALRWLSPLCFVLAGLLHEQMALLLLAASGASLLYLHKEGRATKYLYVLGLLSLAIAIFTFTSPGAYYRLGVVNSAKSGSGLRKLVSGLVGYLSPLGTFLWPYTVALGVCALVLLRRMRGVLCRLLQSLLAFGALLGPLSSVLDLPQRTGALSWGQLLLAAYWGLYYLALLLAFFLAARAHGWRNRYLFVLLLAAFASQLIPAAIGSTGRPMLHLILLTLLISLCVAHDTYQDATAARIGQAAFSLLALCTLLVTFNRLSANRVAFDDIEAQMRAAAQGQSSSVVIDRSRFNYDYCYYNAFHEAYEKDLRHYYQLPDEVSIYFR